MNEIDQEILSTEEFFDEHRERLECDEIYLLKWKKVKSIVRKIYKEIKTVPKIVFIENTIEVRWEKEQYYTILIKFFNKGCPPRDLGYFKEGKKDGYSQFLYQKDVIQWVIDKYNYVKGVVKE